jgi:hypothetical protein
MQPRYPICDRSIVLATHILPGSDKLNLSHDPTSCRILVHTGSKLLSRLPARLLILTPTHLISSTISKPKSNMSSSSGSSRHPMGINVVFSTFVSRPLIRPNSSNTSLTRLRFSALRLKAPLLSSAKAGTFLLWCFNSGSTGMPASSHNSISGKRTASLTISRRMRKLT